MTKKIIHQIFLDIGKGPLTNFPSWIQNMEVNKKLNPDYTGIRPKITKPNEIMRDFNIQTVDEHGISNFINLQGIESPGLTSSLAIAKFVKNLL